jgi:hypothetical protein
MTDMTLGHEMTARASIEESAPRYPSVKPKWLGPLATAAVIATHIGVAVLLMATVIPKVSSLDSISMDLVPEGDFFEAQQVTEAEETPPPEAVEQPDIALPPPMIMAPDALTLPAKQEAVEQKKKVVEHKREVERAQQRREAQAERHYGAPEGRARGTGQSQATCLAYVSAALRRHTPGATSLGPGSAQVSFHINAGGGISVASASGSTAAHTALARRIVASSRGPSSCGSAFVSQAFAFH